MATETSASHQTPLSDQPVETKGNEQVNPTDMEVPSQSIASSEIANKKIDDVPVSEPVTNAVNDKTTAEPPSGTPVKQEEQLIEAAQEKQKVVDAPESSDKTAVKSEVSSVVPPLKGDTEATEQKVLSKELETPKLVPEAMVKLEEQSEGSKQVEKPEIVVPQPQVKPEEQSSITKQDEEQEKSAIPNVQVKLEGESGVAQQVETKSKDENPEADKVKTETIDTLKETVKDESREGQDPNLEKDDLKDKTEQNVKEETPEIGEKLDEGTAKVTETAKESEERGLDAKTNESEVEKEKSEELAKSDILNKKNDDGSEATGEVPAEVSGPKPIQRQSSNFFSKVKQSLMKAKKAITGKSPNPKTESSDTKE